MEFKETQILETGILAKIESPEQANNYIRELFSNYNDWKPDFFRTIEDDIKVIIFNQRIRIKRIKKVDTYYVFTTNVNSGLELIKDSYLRLEKEYYMNKDSKDLMFEFAKTEFDGRMEASFNEKMLIENELKKFTDFENRAKELQREVYKNDTILDEYQSQFEIKYGWHYNEFEYLRMITGYYHYPERENRKTIYFIPTLVKQKLLKQYILEHYKKYESCPGNQLTGFTCNLSPETVEQIFNSMLTSKQISGNLTDFQAIFSNTQAPVKNPVKWLIKSQKKPYRGHQTKLYLFIETMLNGRFSAEDKRKAVDLFIDEKGKFFNPKMKEPNDNDRNTHNIFETLINNAKEKTRPA